MKFLIVTIILSLNLICFSQEQVIIEIENYVSGVQSRLTSLDKAEKINTGTEQKFIYSDNNKIQLISVRTIDNNVEKKVSWYYSNGEYIYSETVWINPDGSLMKNEKLYFDKGSLIKWTTTENISIDTNSEEFKLANKTFYDYGMSLLK